MKVDPENEQALQTRFAVLEARLDQCHAFGNLRRTLRSTDDIEQIVHASQRFATEVLRWTHLAIYVAETESSFERISSDPEGSIELPRTIERDSPVARALTMHAKTSDADWLVELARSTEVDVTAIALCSAPTELIGIAIVFRGSIEDELLDEMAFNIEHVLTARRSERLRAEDLAMFEVQERELVGLLRDVEARDATIQQDLEEARQFQRKMLGAPPTVSGIALEVVYKPLGLVGGDLYSISLDGPRLRLFVADATGHGVRAALTTMFIKSGYEAVRHGAADPAALLSALNDMIAKTYRSTEMLFSAACVDIDLPTGRVLLSSAAHPASCIVHDGDVEFVECSGALLGLRTGMKFELHERTITVGDAVYLYTDGFPEARKQNLLFGDDRFKEALLEAHRTGRSTGETVWEAVTAFLDGTPLDDDGTLVGARYDTPRAPARTPE